MKENNTINANIFGKSKDISFADSSNYNVESLPQISSEDIRDDATELSFICYMYMQEVPTDIIASKTSFTDEEVRSIIVEAIEADELESLAKQFLK